MTASPRLPRVLALFAAIGVALTVALPELAPPAESTSDSRRDDPPAARETSVVASTERTPAADVTIDTKGPGDVARGPATNRMLTVVDDETGVPLPVDIVEGLGIEWMPGTWQERRTIFTAQPTPVRLGDALTETVVSAGRRSAMLRWWIGSRDHEWLMVGVDSFLDPQGDGDGVTLRLQRSGGVQVAMPNAALSKSAVLRIREVADRPPAITDGDWVAQCLRHPGLSVGTFRPAAPSTWIDRIRPGHYRLALEIGEERSPLTLGEVAVDVVAGQIAATELRLFDSATPPPKVRIAGIVRVPIAWRDATELWLRPKGVAEAWAREELGADDSLVKVVLQEPFATSEQDRTWHWDVGARFAGEWEVGVGGTRWSCRLDLRPGHDREYELVVPPPARVRVTLVDAVTGLPREKAPVDEWMAWSATGDGSSSQGSLRFEGRGVFAGDVPAGEVGFWLPNEVTCAPQSWRVVPGENAITIVVHDTGGVRLRMLDDTDLPWSGIEARLVRAAGEDMTSWASFDGDVTSIAACVDGAMSLVVPPIEGLMPVADRSVVVKYGEWTTVTIRLEHRPK